MKKKNKKTKSILKKLTTKNKKRTKEKNKPEKYLTIAFYLLIILVIILLIIVIQKENNTKDNIKSNLIISLVETDSKNEFSLDLSSLKKNEEKEYIFEVTNYNKDIINSIDTSYQVVVDKSSDISLKVYKNNSETNLLPNNDNKFIITSQLSNEEKNSDRYKLIVKKNKNKLKNNRVTIKIEN